MSRLRELAQASYPFAWLDWVEDEGEIGPTGEPVITYDRDLTESEKVFVQYILAAQPKNIRALFEEIDQLKAALARAHIAIPDGCRCYDENGQPLDGLCRLCRTTREHAVLDALAWHREKVDAVRRDTGKRVVEAVCDAAVAVLLDDGPHRAWEECPTCETVTPHGWGVEVVADVSPPSVDNVVKCHRCGRISP